MIILGVADNHDAGAALVQDGQLLAACSQERFDRKKGSGAFPWAAIDAALDTGGVKARDVDRVVFGTAFTPSTLLRRFPALHHNRKAEGGQFDPLLSAYIAYQVALRRTGLHAVEVEASQRLLAHRLRERGFPKAQVVMMDHHEAHAHAAYRAQPHSTALILTVDAMGDGLSATAWVGQVGQLNRHWAQSGLAAVNTFYSRITEWLGFTALRHEGKVTGLAAYAEPPPELLEHMAERLRFVSPGFNRLSPLLVETKDSPFYRALGEFRREEVAAAAQRTLEDAVTAFVAYWVERTGVADVAVAGGAFANVKLNQRVAALPQVRSLFVTPHMGDGGLALGAALGAAGAPPEARVRLDWGPRYTKSQISRELHIARLTAVSGVDAVEHAASLLARGKTVARFAGGMEFGPRALGNRSILVRPDLPEVNDRLNGQLKRTEFMPFAPICAAENAPRLFVGLEKTPLSARHMTVCCDCTEELRRLAPGVVHVDGTARPQLVDASESPRLHRLLRRFEELTGVPALINTSFNMHEEPIVCSPFDAIRAWRAAKLDALMLDDVIVERDR